LGWHFFLFGSKHLWAIVVFVVPINFGAGLPSVVRPTALSSLELEEKWLPKKGAVSSWPLAISNSADQEKIIPA
jgi:hypothetical protein